MNNIYINPPYIRTAIYLTLVMLYASTLSAQSGWQYNNKHDITSVSYTPFRKHEGFSISASLVAMFTSGAANRNGFRLGAGITLSQTVDNWTFATGVDTYQASEKFGLGTTFAGAVFDDGRYGASYYVNKYHQGDKQTSAILGVRLHDLRIRFEDDVLALPFSGFVIHDRYRTAALELQYKGFLVGTNVYTNDANGLTHEAQTNAKGIYKDGKQLSSPIYIGYTNRNMIVRYGINNKIGGLVGQNWWHEKLFDTSNFNTSTQSSHFFQLGVNKPYTLY